MKLIENGNITAADFMAGIAELTDGLVKSHTAAVPEYLPLFPSNRTQSEAIGKCPRCGGDIREAQKGFFCDNRSCKFALWKNNRFFAAKKKEITAEIAAALLKDGRVYMTGLFSEKTGKSYSATILLKDTGEYVNFDMQFEKSSR